MCVVDYSGIITLVRATICPVSLLQCRSGSHNHQKVTEVYYYNQMFLFVCFLKHLQMDAGMSTLNELKVHCNENCKNIVMCRFLVK